MKYTSEEILRIRDDTINDIDKFESTIDDKIKKG